MDSVCVLYLTAVTFSATGLRFSVDERLWGPERGCRQRANTKTMLTAIFLLFFLIQISFITSLLAGGH